MNNYKYFLILLSFVLLAACDSRHEHNDHDSHDDHGHADHADEHDDHAEEADEHDSHDAHDEHAHDDHDEHSRDEHDSDDDHGHGEEETEGHTEISSELIDAFGIETEVAGPASIREYIRVYGTVIADPERKSHVMSRFDGEIKSVRVSIGDQVQKGQTLAVVESNDSLRDFNVTAPIDGMVVQRHANAGEQTGDQLLFTIVDSSSVWAELAVFPRDMAKVNAGQRVIIRKTQGNVEREGYIALLNTVAESNQSVMARVQLENTDSALVPGMYLEGEIEIAVVDVPLAVKRSALQVFEGSSVVYTRNGNEFETRHVSLGREDDNWAEVLGGLEPGTSYVTTNSYVIKADIEKSGASHQH